MNKPSAELIFPYASKTSSSQNFMKYHRYVFRKSNLLDQAVIGNGNINLLLFGDQEIYSCQNSKVCW